MQLAMVKEGVEVFDDGVTALKKIEIINELDKAGALVVNKLGGKAAYALRTPQEKCYDKLELAEAVAKFTKENYPELSETLEQIACKMIIAAAEEIGGVYTWTKHKLVESLEKPKGSKVKADRFDGCPIFYAGDVSYIEIGKGLRLHLTPDCIESCTYDRKKYKMSLGHHHYYCNVNYKDGSRSYIRVSRKHLKNLVKCGLELPEGIELD